MTVLILTCEQDVTADMVVARLDGTGVPVVRLDPADLPGGVALSGEFVHGSFRGHLSAGGRLVTMSGLRSVWVRRAVRVVTFVRVRTTATVVGLPFLVTTLTVVTGIVRKTASTTVRVRPSLVTTCVDRTVFGSTYTRLTCRTIRTRGFCVPLWTVIVFSVVTS